MYLLNIPQSDNDAARTSGGFKKRVYCHKNTSSLAGFPDHLALEITDVFAFLDCVAEQCAVIGQSFGKTSAKRLPTVSSGVNPVSAAAARLNEIMRMF
ncbi:MAG TPA: hypothetical protein VHM64_20990 [Candidatus Binatia bacterium]|nr:hypothetical protein [Candidatus Binatia bacterium]